MFWLVTLFIAVAVVLVAGGLTAMFWGREAALKNARVQVDLRHAVEAGRHHHARAAELERELLALKQERDTLTTGAQAAANAFTDQRKALLARDEKLARLAIAAEDALRRADEATRAAAAQREELASLTANRDEFVRIVHTQDKTIGQLQEELAAKQAAVAKHHAAEGHDRCWENDAELHREFGLEARRPALPDLPEFIANCCVYWRQQAAGLTCPGATGAVSLYKQPAKAPQIRCMPLTRTEVDRVVELLGKDTLTRREYGFLWGRGLCFDPDPVDPARYVTFQGGPVIMEESSGGADQVELRQRWELALAGAAGGKRYLVTED
jgi:hypothetical protein